MEMEVLYSRSLDANGAGAMDDSDEDNNGGAGSKSLYKSKYERAAKELEVAKKRLQDAARG